MLVIYTTLPFLSNNKLDVAVAVSANVGITNCLENKLPAWLLPADEPNGSDNCAFAIINEKHINIDKIRFMFN